MKNFNVILAVVVSSIFLFSCKSKVENKDASEMMRLKSALTEKTWDLKSMELPLDVPLYREIKDVTYVPKKLSLSFITRRWDLMLENKNEGTSVDLIVNDSIVNALIRDKSIVAVKVKNGKVYLLKTIISDFKDITVGTIDTNPDWLRLDMSTDLKLEYIPGIK